MIAKFFNETKPINFLVLTILSLFVFILAVFLHFDSAFSARSIFKIFLNLFLFLLFLFFHNFIIRKNSLTKNNSYALLFFILLFAMFPYAGNNYKLLISNFFIFFSIRRIYSIRSGIAVKSKLFDSAFWVGIAFLIYDWSILFLFFIYIAIFVFREIKWNYFFIPVIGFITPVYLYYVYLLTFGKEALFEKLWTFNTGFDFSNYNQISLLLPISIVLVFIIWTVYPTLLNAFYGKKKRRSSFILLLYHLALTMVIAIIAPHKDGSEFLFLFFPFSVLMANYLQIIKEYWFKETVIILFFVLTIVVLSYS
ncbi:MAG: hypothetical protein DSY82_09140 [Flavobacteriia bacterium]|nr:MAG: hypothetical protein DSY82_09140 [Flavobacteriia bacterium]